jgi:eukaryotic-like serine/threonine-protein kinase
MMDDEVLRDSIQRAGKYEIVVELTEGANAYSYKANHLLRNVPVFLKAYYSDPQMTDSSLEEPRNLANATQNNSVSKNLVQLYDIDAIPLVDGDIYILMAMEWIDGASLLSRLQANGCFPLMNAIEIVKQVIIGLSSIHNQRFVHRDIKPANIMLSESEGLLTSKIGDFGSVKMISTSSDFTTASKRSSLYVPPEGWDTPGRYGVQSDIYQVGLVFWELLNGPLPDDPKILLDTTAIRKLKKEKREYEYLDDYEKCKLENECICRRAGSGEIITLIESKSYLPTQIKRIINKAIHPQLISRYKSCSEIYNDLSALVFPNWYYSNNEFIAKNWKGYDYRIIQETQKRSSVYQTYRCKCDTQNWRKWKASTANVKELFDRALL